MTLLFVGTHLIIVSPMGGDPLDTPNKTVRGDEFNITKTDKFAIISMPANADDRLVG